MGRYALLQGFDFGAALEGVLAVTTSFENDRRVETTSPSQTRGKTRLFWDVIFRALRLIRKHVENAYVVFGIFLLSGAVVAVVFTWVFSEIAERVRAGSTQGFDESVMRWIGAHQYPGVQTAMLEITSLGTGTVVAMIVLVAGMFLWLNQHKHSAILLLVATLG